MATIAEQLIGSALESAQKAPDLGQAISRGAELAKSIQDTQIQREALEQKKAELQQQKLSHFGDLVSKVHEFKDSGAKSGYVKFLQAQNQQLNLGIAPEALNFAFAGPENIQRVATLQTMVQNGDISGTQAIGILSQPDQFANLVPKQILDKYKGPTFDSAALQNIDTQDAADKIAAANKEHQSNLAQAQRAQSYNTQAETRKDEQSAQAVERINNDSVLSALTQQARNISKGTAILNGNPSWVRLNEVAQDYSAALAGKGTGSDFKLKEIKKESIAQHLGDLKTLLSSDPDQPASPEAVAFWRKMGDDLAGQYHQQIGSRASQKGREARTVYSKNPNAVKAVEETVKTYKNGTWNGDTPMVTVGGRLIPADQAKAFYQAHPQFKPSAETKKILEGGQ